MEDSTPKPHLERAVWPPPVPESRVALASLHSSYVSQRRAGARVKVTGIIFAVILAFGAALRSEGPSSNPVQLMAGGVYAILYLIFLALLAVFFLMWVYGVQRNLTAFNVRGINYSPGWAVAYYLIPIINLFRPYLDMSDAWKASDPVADSQNKESWPKGSGSGMVNAWWALWVLWLALGEANNIIKRNGSPSNEISVEVACGVVGMFGIFAMIRVVSLMNDRQDAKEAALIRAELPTPSSESL